MKINYFLLFLLISLITLSLLNYKNKEQFGIGKSILSQAKERKSLIDSQKMIDKNAASSPDNLKNSVKDKLDQNKAKRAMEHYKVLVSEFAKNPVGFFMGTPPTKCVKGYQHNGAGLCLEECPADPVEIDFKEQKVKSSYVWDKAQRCILDCPSNWEGTTTSDHCQKKTKYSTVGADTSKSIPKGCLKKDHPVEDHLSLCYDLPDNNWMVNTPGFIRKKCPSGTYYNGTSCAYDRGVGTIPKKKACDSGQRDDGTSCWEDAHIYGRIRAAGWNGNCNSDETKRCEGVCGASLVTCYKKCKSGYHNDGLTCRKTDIGIKKTLMDRQYCDSDRDMEAGLCYKKPKDGFKCGATLCTNDNPPKPKVGRLPDKCPDDRELHGRLCYPPCPKYYTRDAGNVEMCSESCPPGFNDIGIGGCEKPVKWLPVGKSILDPKYGDCGPTKTMEAGLCKPQLFPEFLKK